VAARGTGATVTFKKPVDREPLLLLCLPTPAVKVTVTCNKEKQRTTAVDFNFFFLVQIGFSPFSFFDYTAGQFVVGFVFSSALGGRSGVWAAMAVQQLVAGSGLLGLSGGDGNGC
jgi:hypothetical protein